LHCFTFNAVGISNEQENISNHPIEPKQIVVLISEGDMDTDPLTQTLGEIGLSFVELEQEKFVSGDSMSEIRIVELITLNDQ
jgi:hypothetical protein